MYLRFLFYQPKCKEDPQNLDMSCLGSYGGPINPNVAIGSFDSHNYFNGTHAVISIPVMNDPETAARAIVWEKSFLEYVQNFIQNESTVNVTGLNPDNLNPDKSDWALVKLKVAYTSERLG